jgi:glucose/arabinose dehydrogenase
MRNRSAAVSAALAGLAAGVTGAGAQSVTWVPYVNGLTRPLYVTAPPGDLNRLFIVEQRGSGGVSSQAYIRIFNIATGTLNATPFLAVTGLGVQSEQGLLGLAFDPNYDTNGYFYIDYVANVGNGVSHVDRYQVSASNPDVANPASATSVLTVTQPFVNHNGGWVNFGPDGYLYISFGDGGSQGDPNGNGQNTNVLLGKILRINVATLPYTIPSTNPFFGSTTQRPEIWAYGLRNPWRPGFDRQTGDLWIADVGQDTWEEINFQPRPVDPPYPARDYGWHCYEANAAYNLTGCAAQSTMTFPIYAYHHNTDPNCSGSITGGFVYRGCAMPDLRGTYFFADYCQGFVASLRYVNGAVTEYTNRGNLSAVMSFGEDALGELYMCSGSTVYKIVPRCAVNCDSTTFAPYLNVADFTCYLQRFAAHDCYANCDGSTLDPVLNVADFTCFLQKFAAGCSAP